MIIMLIETQLSATKNIENALLSVNHDIRAELLSLLFNGTNLALEYPLQLQPMTLVHITRLTLTMPAPGNTPLI